MRWTSQSLEFKYVRMSLFRISNKFSCFKEHSGLNLLFSCLVLSLVASGYACACFNPGNSTDIPNFLPKKQSHSPSLKHEHLHVNIATILPTIHLSHHDITPQHRRYHGTSTPRYRTLSSSTAIRNHKPQQTTPESLAKPHRPIVHTNRPSTLLDTPPSSISGTRIRSLRLLLSSRRLQPAYVSGERPLPPLQHLGLRPPADAVAHRCRRETDPLFEAATEVGEAEGGFRGSKCRGRSLTPRSQPPSRHGRSRSRQGVETLSFLARQPPPLPLRIALP